MMAAIKLVWSDFLELSSTAVSMYTPGKPGVYRLSYQDEATGVRTVFYVGQAQDLRSRLAEHFVSKDGNPCIATTVKAHRCFFRYAVIPEEAQSMAIVKAMCQRFQPQCNDPQSVPDVPPADVNLE